MIVERDLAELIIIIKMIFKTHGSSVKEFTVRIFLIYAVTLSYHKPFGLLSSLIPYYSWENEDQLEKNRVPC